VLVTATLERPTTQAAPVATRRVRLDGREFETTGQRVIDFIETNCVHGDGEWIGQPAILMAWQKRYLYELFEVEPATGLRRYRRALLGIPKKNGKSALAAWLALYFLLADGEPAPLVVCGANSDEQADLVFGTAKTCCELSPTLAPLTERFQKEITVPSLPGARLVRVSATVGTNDGKNIHAVILDELHEFSNTKGRGVWRVLTKGTVGRKQSMILQITTAGFDLETVCGEQYLKGRGIEEAAATGQPNPDRRFHFRWYQAAPGTKYGTEEYFKSANPSYGITIDWPAIEDELNNSPEADNRRFHGNEWTERQTLWLNAGEWDACNGGDWQPDPKRPLFAAVDASTKHDTTAVVIAQWDGERLRVKARIWERPVGVDGKPLPDWRIPLPEVENYILDLFAKGNVKSVAYDPAFVTWMADSLEARGVPMLEFAQTNSRMVSPTKRLYELIKDQRLAHDGDPRFARHIRNALYTQVSGGGGRLTKPKNRPEDATRNANDAAIGLVMVVSEAGEPPEPERAAPGVIIL
jgi:phage terminase large subunit-like protein